MSEKALTRPGAFSGGRLDLHPERRFFLLKAVVALGFAGGFLLSYKEWVSTRAFPLTPVWDALRLPYPFDFVLFGMALFLLVPIAASRSPRAYIIAFVVLAGALALLDQQRWQPWFYQYLFMFGALAFYGGDGSQVRLEQVLNACRIIAASLYIWSGIQKVNYNFVENTWPWMTEPIADFLPASTAILDYMVYAAPLLEFSIGVGLLTLRFRNVAVIMALSLHAFIMLCIGPWGLDFNSVVWPWNFAMPAAVFLLFWRTPGPTIGGVFARGNLYNKLVIVLFLVMPAFNLFGMWDSFLSASLYTGNTKRAVIYMDERASRAMPPGIQAHIRPSDESEAQILDTFDWAFDEINAPPFPEERVFKNIQRKVCRHADESPNVAMIVIGKLDNPLKPEKPETTYRCSDL